LSVTGKIHYANKTGKILRRRGGEEIRPLADFWTTEYEPTNLGLTILEDNTAPVVPIVGADIVASGAPQQVLLPPPMLHPYYLEVTVQAASDGAAIKLGFNRSSDPTSQIDALTSFCQVIDTRKVFCLWLSGSGLARVIFKEVIG
jgi:hypothetical protein